MKNLSIGQKIAVLVGVFILAVGTGLVTGAWQMRTLSEIRAMRQTAEESGRSSLALAEAAEQMRAASLLLVETQKPDTRDQFAAALASARGSLGELPDGTVRDGLTANIGGAEQAFGAAYQAVDHLGFTEDQGLRGQLRDAVHAVEERLNKVVDMAIGTKLEAANAMLIKMLMMRRHEKDYMLRGDREKYLSRITDRQAEFLTILASAPMLDAEKETLTSLLADYVAGVTAYADGVDALADATAHLNGLIDDLTAGAHAAASAAQTEWVAANGDEQAAFETFSLAVGGGAVAVIGLLVVVGAAVGRQIAGPIKTMAQCVDDLAADRMGAAVPFQDRRDEVGQMARALNVLHREVEEAFRLRQMVEGQATSVLLLDTAGRIAFANAAMRALLRRAGQGLRVAEDQMVGRTIAQVHGEGAALESALDAGGGKPSRTTMGTLPLAVIPQPITDSHGAPAGTMVVVADKTAQEDLIRAFDSSIKQVAQAIADTAEMVRTEIETVAGGAADARSRAEEAGSGARESLSNVETVASATHQLTASISEIGRSVTRATDLAQAAVSQAEATDHVVAGLSEGADRIGAVVELISSIADQTNLLALNATIEAARAGEAGKGFSVVAGEVKTLANQTAKATEEIATQINGLRASTGEAVGAIRAIGDAIQEISETVGIIAAAMEQQGSATREIGQAVEAAAGTSGAVATSMDGTISITEVLNRATERLSTSARTLSEQSNTLDTQVGQFLQTISR